MSKELEALTYFKTLFDIWKEKISVDDDTKEIEEEYEFNPRYELIEKSLKALEIIKEKRVDISDIFATVNYADYKRMCDEWRQPLSQEEYDLLKEILL